MDCFVTILRRTSPFRSCSPEENEIITFVNLGTLYGQEALIETLKREMSQGHTVQIVKRENKQGD